jgi:hypothetical protein
LVLVETGERQDRIMVLLVLIQYLAQQHLLAVAMAHQGLLVVMVALAVVAV